jgi:nucleoside 2-deoxyribosyltransferase
MKIYLSHAKKLDFINELYEPIKRSDLANKHQFIFPHEDNKVINCEEIFRNKEVDLILAEVSIPATGQGIELGYAEILEIPIICIHKKGSEVAGSLKWITNKFIEYENSSDLVEKLKKEIGN